MGHIILGIGDTRASADPEDVLRTLGLGSCVAIIFLDTTARVAGMAHVALPEARTCPERAAHRPGYCADTAIPHLLRKMRNAGASPSIRDYTVKLVGGAHILDPNRAFDLGHRNVLAIRRILWQHGTGPLAEDLGGDFSRSVEVRLSDGAVLITSPGRTTWAI